MNHSFRLKEIGPVPTRTSQEIRGSRIGIGFETLDRELFNPERCYDQLSQTGAKWARCQTGWNRCETVKGQFDFQWLDDVVDNLLVRGIEPWFNVGFGNKLYMPDAPGEAAVGCVPVLYGPEAQEAWRLFLRKLTEHFKGRVRRYEIWNEANHPGFWWPGKSSAKEYTQLVAMSAGEIKAVDPDAFISACCAGGASQFILDALREGIGAHIGAFAIHPYGTVPELNYTEGVAALRSQFRQYAPHVELWMGECGCPSQTYGHNDEWLNLFNMDETKQAKWMLRRLLTDLALGLEHVSYFHATDLMEKEYRQANGEVRKPVMTGLLHGKVYTPKEAFHSFAGICSLFDAQTRPAALSCHCFASLGRCESKLVEVAIKKLTFERNGYPLYAYYLPEDVQLETPVRNNIGLSILDDAPRKIDEPVLVDLLQMKVFAIESMKPGAWAFADIEGLPLADYPLIITDRKALG